MKVFDSWPSFAGQEVHCASWPSFAGQQVHCASWPSFAGQVHCVSWPSFAGQVQTVDAIGAAYFAEVPITFIAEIQKKICEWDTTTSWTIKINDKEREGADVWKETSAWFWNCFTSLLKIRWSSYTMPKTNSIIGSNKKTAKLPGILECWFDVFNQEELVLTPVNPLLTTLEMMGLEHPMITLLIVDH